jgi:hypothetical protein
MSSVTASNAQPAPSAGLINLFGAAAIWIGYTLVFILTIDIPLGKALLDAATNALPLLLAALVTLRLLRGHVFGLPPRLQALAHVVLAPSFAIGWYSGILVLQALLRWATTGEFKLIGFSGPALPWQTFQGMILYTLTVAVAAASAAPAPVGEPGSDNGRTSGLQRYLLRTDDGLVPIDVGDIVSIVGAQDYAEVVTARGRHLAKVTLAEFEQRLDVASFVRVHRSAIVNLHWIERVEPAGGGRMTAIMQRGDPVAVSRAGAQLLRAFAV